MRFAGVHRILRAAIKGIYENGELILEETPPTQQRCAAGIDPSQA
jgi:hypothetical protein